MEKRERERERERESKRGENLRERRKREEEKRGRLILCRLYPCHKFLATNILQIPSKTQA
jgi:hypothetical protein